MIVDGGDEVRSEPRSGRRHYRRPSPRTPGPATVEVRPHPRLVAKEDLCSHPLRPAADPWVLLFPPPSHRFRVLLIRPPQRPLHAQSHLSQQTAHRAVAHRARNCLAINSRTIAAVYSANGNFSCIRLFSATVSYTHRNCAPSSFGRRPPRLRASRLSHPPLRYSASHRNTVRRFTPSAAPSPRASPRTECLRPPVGAVPSASCDPTSARLYPCTQYMIIRIQMATIIGVNISLRRWSAQWKPTFWPSSVAMLRNVWPGAATDSTTSP